MDYPEFIESSRQLRSKLFDPLGKSLLKFKIKANHLTFLSLIFGLFAVFYLFQNSLLFVIFALLHLLADSLDGVLARLTRPTSFGQHFDCFADRLVSFLILIKLYFFLKDYYVLFIAALLFFNYSFHLLFNLKSPAIFFRTGLVVSLFIYCLFPYPLLLTLAYLLAGIIYSYSLLLQLRYFLIKSQ